MVVISTPTWSATVRMPKPLAMPFMTCFDDTRTLGMDALAQTAQWTAAARARESQRPDHLFEDPLAALLAGEDGFALLDAEPPEARDNPYLAIRTRMRPSPISAQPKAGWWSR